ncbi:MAG: hypothetical protein QG571_533, partial [Pseudomonadota bacterium]|nr:hypothetical protein [Pseudomonadota bacterium]
PLFSSARTPHATDRTELRAAAADAALNTSAKRQLCGSRCSVARVTIPAIGIRCLAMAARHAAQGSGHGCRRSFDRGTARAGSGVGLGDRSAATGGATGRRSAREIAGAPPPDPGGFVQRSRTVRSATQSAGRSVGSRDRRHLAGSACELAAAMHQPASSRERCCSAPAEASQWRPSNGSTTSSPIVAGSRHRALTL